MCSNYAIAVIAYNRLESMKRLLKSIEHTDFEGESVDLIFDIDNCGNDTLIRYAEQYFWKYGKKIVKTYPERLGLRTHMIEVGENLQKYDAIAVLEDDVFVSPHFYKYMKQTVDFYKNDMNIFSIALYSRRENQSITRPFYPIMSGYDVYFQQDPISWGQIWLKKQWFAFKEWYLEENGNYKIVPDIPRQISAFPESSYLKYLAKYCALNHKYFVMPYKSYSTCFSDLGEHTRVSDSTVQVPFLFGQYQRLKLVPLKECTVVYDNFYENKQLAVMLNWQDVCIDLYNNKQNYENKRYWLTTGIYDYKIIKSYGLIMKPHEMNVIYQIEGKQIFLYDTSVAVKNKMQHMAFEEAVYDMGQQAQQFSYAGILLKGKIRDKLLKFKRKFSVR